MLWSGTDLEPDSIFLLRASFVGFNICFVGNHKFSGLVGSVSAPPHRTFPYEAKGQGL